MMRYLILAALAVAAAVSDDCSERHDSVCRASVSVLGPPAGDQTAGSGRTTPVPTAQPQTGEARRANEPTMEPTAETSGPTMTPTTTPATEDGPRLRPRGDDGNVLRNTEGSGGETEPEDVVEDNLESFEASLTNTRGEITRMLRVATRNLEMYRPKSEIDPSWDLDQRIEMVRTHITNNDPVDYHPVVVALRDLSDGCVKGLQLF